MDRDEWLVQFAAEVGVSPPTAAEAEVLLNLAGVAARSSERTAAPITCWLAARAGLDPAAALAIANRLADTSTGDTPA